MTQFEYKVIPAPAKGEKARGVRSPEARFAYALEQLMNKMSAEGWEYQRADMLPSEERQGLTGTTTNWRNVLVFRRPLSDNQVDQFEPRLLEAPKPDAPILTGGAERMLKDNGVEEFSDVSGVTNALLMRARQTRTETDPPGAPDSAPAGDPEQAEPAQTSAPDRPAEDIPPAAPKPD